MPTQDAAPPTLSYTKTLEAKVAELEATVAQLRNPQCVKSEGKSGSEEPPPTSFAEAPEPSPEADKSGEQPETELSRDFEGLKVEDDGRVSYHGQTSLFHLPSGVMNENLAPTHLGLGLDARKERLINNAWRERAFEQLACIPEPFQYLLDSHWCWIQPLFNFVYRPAFTRDMKMNGPYYSDILLNAMLSHSVRWCKAEAKVARLLESFDNGAQFFHRAVCGLYEALKYGHGQIPTVQALLLLSAQECGRGNRTQAWVYSGMAFRLVEDMGICIDSRKYSGSAQFSDEDIEIRNRLFWSCYFWDKLISLYFGRSPIMQNSRVSPPRIILDDTAEIEIWTPHGVIFPEGTHYPPTQAHSTSCFMKMCGLAEILNQILIHMYDPMKQSTEAEFQTCVNEQGERLSVWWDELPGFLKLQIADLPQYSPPSHVVTLNCFYHTINILLHRPMLCSRPHLVSNQQTPDANHLIQCMSSATSIVSLYDLYRRTFGDGHVVLSLAYSVYTAASIFLLEIQALKCAVPSTLDKLRHCISALERVKASNPVINTALQLINQELQKLRIDIQGPGYPEDSQPASQSYPTAADPPADVSPSYQQQSSYDFESNNDFDMKVPPAELNQNMSSENPPIPPNLMPSNLMNADPYEVTPEVFEAFSYVEPITTNVGSDFDMSWLNNETM
ncbi:hypothetical protein FQN54_001252 [Arachnomyces sp. PD_36]|nr:hypothetical protein FQN54_001252 [Arachnomyces sp. PD_36]